MELSLILMQKIGSLFLAALAGYLLVKFKVLKAEDGKPISLVLLYAIGPCAFLNAFIQPFSKERITGLILAILVSAVIQFAYIGAAHLIAGRLGLSVVEEASLSYTNSGNLILPLVSSLLGEEWIFYSCAYMFVQTILFWVHLYPYMSGDRRINVKKILLNPNILAIFLGLFFFLTGIPLPLVVSDGIKSLASAIGGIAMLIIGISLAACDLKKVFCSSARIYQISFMKMILFPAAAVLLIACSGILTLHPQAKEILMITIMAAAAPAASTVTQFAQMFGKDYDTASSINICTVVWAVVTMPLIILLYQILL